MVTDHPYDPALDEPALSVRELAGLFGEIIQTGDTRILTRAKRYLDLLLDGTDPGEAWEASGLAKSAGPFDPDGDGFARRFRFRGLPGRLL